MTGKREDGIKMKFRKALTYGPGQHNEGWYMRGSYYTGVAESGKLFLNVLWALGAPETLDVDSNHFASWVMTENNSTEYEVLWSGYD